MPLPRHKRYRQGLTFENKAREPLMCRRHLRGMELPEERGKKPKLDERKLHYEPRRRLDDWREFCIAASDQHEGIRGELRQQEGILYHRIGQFSSLAPHPLYNPVTITAILCSYRSTPAIVPPQPGPFTIGGASLLRSYSPSPVVCMRR